MSVFEKVNTFFQSTNTDPEAISKELDILYRCLKPRVFNKDDEKLSITMSDLGAHFMNELTRCSRNKDSNMTFNNTGTGLKKRCQDFILDLIKEMEKRLPANKKYCPRTQWVSPIKITISDSKVSIFTITSSLPA